ncbi:MAG: hypothetical protein ABJR23_14530, partial [Paracoccaceae bacterium]
LIVLAFAGDSTTTTGIYWKTFPLKSVASMAAQNVGCKGELSIGMIRRGGFSDISVGHFRVAGRLVGCFLKA